MSKTFSGYLKALKRKKNTISIHFSVNIREPDIDDQHPLYTVAGSIVDVGDDYLLIDIADYAFDDAEKDVIAVPFGSIAFVFPEETWTKEMQQSE